MQASQAIGGVRRWRGFDPLRTLHRLLTSVRVALLLLAAVAVGALIGVIFPQAPDEVRAATGTHPSRSHCSPVTPHRPRTTCSASRRSALSRSRPSPGWPGMEGAALLQLGTSIRGERQLDVLNMDGAPGQASSTATGGDASAGLLDLAPGVSQVQHGYEFTFLEVRSITGITVRRDPGATIIWVATALLLIGLFVTFYVPRRRLWARITPERTYLAGVADGIVNFSAEMRRLGVNAGSPGAGSGDGDE